MLQFFMEWSWLRGKKISMDTSAMSLYWKRKCHNYRREVKPLDFRQQ